MTAAAPDGGRACLLDEAAGDWQAGGAHPCPCRRHSPPPRVVPALGLIRLGWNDMKEVVAELLEHRRSRRKR